MRAAGFLVWLSLPICGGFVSCLLLVQTLLINSFRIAPDSMGFIFSISLSPSFLPTFLF